MNTLASTQYSVKLAINVTAKTEIGSFMSPIDLLDLSMLLFWLLQLQLFFSRIHLPRIRLFPLPQKYLHKFQVGVMSVVISATQINLMLHIKLDIFFMLLSWGLKFRQSTWPYKLSEKGFRTFQRCLYELSYLHYWAELVTKSRSKTSKV